MGWVLVCQFSIPLRLQPGHLALQTLAASHSNPIDTLHTIEGRDFSSLAH